MQIVDALAFVLMIFALGVGWIGFCVGLAAADAVSNSRIRLIIRQDRPAPKDDTRCP